MDQTFTVDSYAGPIAVNRRDSRTFVTIDDREFRLVTEEQFACDGDDQREVTYESLGIDPADVAEAQRGFTRLFR